MSRTALVLCGGLGTRFASVSQTPKILAKFREGKFIDWLIEYLIDHNFVKIVLSLGHNSELILNHITRISKNIKIDYIIEDTPLGTGGAIKSYLKNNFESEVYIFNGDTFFSQELPTQLFDKCLENKFAVICKTFPLNDRYGDFSLHKHKLGIKRGSESVPIEDSKVYCGVARVPNTATFDDLPLKFSTEDFFLKQDHEFVIIEYSGDVIDYGIPEAYIKLTNLYGQ
jgi:D-glycero-alpha-D-manno-heptose 1-phosphate guanylyltransferase